jgi:hypothetical protein
MVLSNACLSRGTSGVYPVLHSKHNDRCRRKAVCGQQRGQAVQNRGTTRSGIFGWQQLLRASRQLASSYDHVSRVPRCNSCMHGESRIEYSVSYTFHDFFIRGRTRNKLYTGTFTGPGTAEFTGFRVHGSLFQQESRGASS